MRRVAIAALLLVGCGGDTAPDNADAGTVTDTVALEDVGVDASPEDPQDASDEDAVSVQDVPDEDAGEDTAGDGDAVGGDALAADGDATPDGQDAEDVYIDTWVAPQVPGDHCDEPLLIDPLDLPFQYDGDTAYAADDVSLAGGCGTGGDIGAGAPDVVFSFTPGGHRAPRHRHEPDDGHR